MSELDGAADDGSVAVLYLGEIDLADFRMMVARWANSFDPKYRTLCYVLGTLAGLDTCIARVSQNRLLERMQEAYERQGKDLVGPGRTWLQTRLRELEQARIIDSWQPRSGKEWDSRAAFRTNRYQI